MRELAEDIARTLIKQGPENIIHVVALAEVMGHREGAGRSGGSLRVCYRSVYGLRALAGVAGGRVDQGGAGGGCQEGAEGCLSTRSGFAVGGAGSSGAKRDLVDLAVRNYYSLPRTTS